jgi:rhodanese-related sulfurtransferase
MKYVQWLSMILGAVLAGCATGCNRSARTGSGASGAAVHVDPAGAESLLAAQKPVVLDLRTAGEFADGHLPGATNIDFLSPSFPDALAKLDRAPSYLVYCASGGRSTRSLPVFEKLGFASIAHLDGGFNAWRKAGKLIAR